MATPPSPSIQRNKHPQYQEHEPTHPEQPSINSAHMSLDKKISEEADPAVHPYGPNSHDSESSPRTVADDSVPDPLYPPAPDHYSFPTTLWYRVISAILSLLFLCIVVVFAIVKTIPSIAWVLWSWLQFKDPDRYRPFYEQEKRRKNIDQGKLKCDIGYYARREGLDCEETKIETDDGFILTLQHIIDNRPGAVDFKRIPVL